MLKHDKRREKMGAYPRVDIRPELSDELEAQLEVVAEVPKTNEVDEPEEPRGYIPETPNSNLMNADRGPGSWAEALKSRRKS